MMRLPAPAWCRQPALKTASRQKTIKIVKFFFIKPPMSSFSKLQHGPFQYLLRLFRSFHVHAEHKLFEFVAELPLQGVQVVFSVVPEINPLARLDGLMVKRPPLPVEDRFVSGARRPFQDLEFRD